MTNRPKKSGTSKKRHGVPPAHHMQTTPLDDESRDAVATLNTSMLVLREMLEIGQLPSAPTHIVARMDGLAMPVIRAAWTVASAILRRTIAPDTPEILALDAARKSLDDAMASLPGSQTDLFMTPRGGLSTRARRAAESAARDDSGTLIHEVALEEFDAGLFLGTDRTGIQVMVWQPVARANAFIELLEPVFETAEEFVHVDELLAVERQAAHWWFNRWPVTNVDGTAFPQRVREQEWFFADRHALSCDALVIEELTEPPFDDMLPPRQRMLVAALSRSQSSMFVVRDRVEQLTTLEDITDGAIYVIHEHSTTVNYRVGDVGAGRVFHLDDGLAVRSPGMLFFTPPGGAAHTKDLGRTLHQLSRVMSQRAIAVETLVAATFGQKVPRSAPLGCSRREARDRLQELHELLLDAGHGEEVEAAAAPSALRGAVDGERTLLLSFDLDEPLADYASALAKHAGIEPREIEPLP